MTLASVLISYATSKADKSGNRDGTLPTGLKPKAAITTTWIKCDTLRHCKARPIHIFGVAFLYTSVTRRESSPVDWSWESAFVGSSESHSTRVICQQLKMDGSENRNLKSTLQYGQELNGTQARNIFFFLVWPRCQTPFPSLFVPPSFRATLIIRKRKIGLRIQRLN